MAEIMAVLTALVLVSQWDSTGSRAPLMLVVLMTQAGAVGLRAGECFPFEHAQLSGVSGFGP